MQSHLIRLWLQGMLWAVYLVFWLGGMGGHVLHGGTPAHMAWAAPLFLILAALIALVSAPEEWQLLLIAAAVGFVAEIIGVHTGFPFGGYRYTAALAPSVAGVPVAIAGAWLVLFAYIRQMRVNIWWSAAWMVGIDLLIDPLAAHDLGYWRWQSGGAYFGVPAVNFLGWYCVSAAIFALVRTPPRPSFSIQALGLTIIVFFAVIAAVHGFLFPATLGAGLGAVGYFRCKSSSVSTMI